MRNELLSWAEESKKGVILNGFIIGPKGLAVYIDTLVTKINSIPVPSVEGYLEDVNDWPEPTSTIGADPKLCMYKDDALTALRELKEDCEDKLRENAYGWVLKCNELKAEVDRLMGIIKEYQTPDVNPPKQ